jgi:hypothetical protein
MLSVLQVCLSVTKNFKIPKENHTDRAQSKVTEFMEIKHIFISEIHDEEEVELQQSSGTKQKETIFSVSVHFCLTLKSSQFQLLILSPYGQNNVSRNKSRITILDQPAVSSF